MNRLYIDYGTDPSEMTYGLMRNAEVVKKLAPGFKIVVKPNLVVPRPAAEGATTHPEIIDGIIRFLKDAGVNDITIAEGSWVGVKSTSHAFKKCGYTAFQDKYNVKLLDTKDDSTVVREYDGLKLKVCKTFYDADYLINVPVLKGHCQTKMTCCLKNLKGCIPDSEKRRYHSLGLTHPIAALNLVLQPNLHIIDAICGDLDFEEGGTPIESNRIILSYDGVLADSYGASLMGYNTSDIGYLQLAIRHGLGNPFSDITEIIEYNTDKKPQAKMPLGTAQKLSVNINEKQACSACYANLIFALNRLKKPPKDKIAIGRGFRGKTFPGVGVGSCTGGCVKNLAGCPPTALDIVHFLQNIEN